MDRYDEQIVKIRSQPASKRRDFLYSQWVRAIGLFQMVKADPDKIALGDNDRPSCGCLTMIKTGRYVPHDRNGMCDESLRDEILADPIIPQTVREIDPDDGLTLERFAMYQRRFDKLLRSTTEE